MNRKITFNYTHKDGTRYTANETLAAIGAKNSAGMWMTRDDKRQARGFVGSEEEAALLLDELELKADSRYWFWYSMQ